MVPRREGSWLKCNSRENGSKGWRKYSICRVTVVTDKKLIEYALELLSNAICYRRLVSMQSVRLKVIVFFVQMLILDFFGRLVVGFQRFFIKKCIYQEWEQWKWTQNGNGNTRWNAYPCCQTWKDAWYAWLLRFGEFILARKTIPWKSFCWVGENFWNMFCGWERSELFMKIGFPLSIVNIRTIYLFHEQSKKSSKSMDSRKSAVFFRSGFCSVFLHVPPEPWEILSSKKRSLNTYLRPYL